MHDRVKEEAVRVFFSGRNTAKSHLGCVSKGKMMVFLGNDIKKSFLCTGKSLRVFYDVLQVEGKDIKAVFGVIYRCPEKNKQDL